MGTRNLLDYIDECAADQFSTPQREPSSSSSSGSRRSCLSSSRKSGRFRKLYTVQHITKEDENERCLKRRRLSSISHNATLGNTSHIDSSLDIVDTTPHIETTKSITSFAKQSYLNQTSVGLQGSNLKFTLQSKLASLHDVQSDRLTTYTKDSEKIENGPILKENKTRNISVHGITSLIKSPVSKSSETNTSDDLSSDTLSSTTDETPGKGRLSRRVLFTPEISNNCEEDKSIRKEILLQTPCRTIVCSGQELRNIEDMTMCSPRPTKFLNGLVDDEKNEVMSKKTPSNHQSLKDRIMAMSSRSRQSAPSPLKTIEEELPPTQPVSTLLFQDIIMYVEVRSGGDNRSMGIKAHLRSLGANVRDKFTNDVTHVIFNEGLMSTYKKAMKKNIHLVSVIWIEECKKAQRIVSERLYPPCDIEKYQSPFLLKKFRKVRSYQPDFGEMGVTRRRRQRKKTAPEKENEPETDLPEYLSYKKKIKVPNFLENASKENELVRTLLTVADIGPEYEDVVNRPTSPTLSEEEDMPHPPTLAVRLLRKMLTPKSSPSASFKEEASSYTPQNSSGPVVEATPERQIMSYMETRNLLSCEKTPVNSNTPRDNVYITNRPSNSNEQTESSVKSPMLGRSTLQKLNKSGINNTGYSDTLEGITSRDVSTSNSGTIIFAPSDKAEGSRKQIENSRVRKGVKRRYSKINEISAKITSKKCTKQLESSSKKVSKSATRLDKNASVNTENDNSKNKEKENRGLSTKKRKLMTLHSRDSPEELDISNMEEDTIVSQCPYFLETSDPSRIASTSNAKFSKEKRKVKVARRKCDLSSDKDEIVNKIGCSSRSSSGEFVAKVPQAITPKNKPKSDKVAEKKLPSLVCTSLQRHEVEVVAAVINKLGGFVIEEKVSAHTTHVITSGPKRTLNLLKGIARGCWIVLQEWALRSLESEKWLDEDEFELSDFSPAVQQCRIQRLSFGRYYKQDLFSKCGSICVSRQSVPPKQELEELIKLCGGKVVSARRSAEYMVGNPTSVRYDKLKYVSEKWVLDSIQFCTLKPVSDYEI